MRMVTGVRVLRRPASFAGGAASRNIARFKNGWQGERWVKIGDKMADTEDPIQQAADAAIKKWADRSDRRNWSTVRAQWPSGSQASLHASTAIRKLLQRREEIDEGEF